MSETKLRPCPKCGTSEGVRVRRETGAFCRWFFVRCDTCLRMGPRVCAPLGGASGPYEKQAAGAWNGVRDGRRRANAMREELLRQVPDWDDILEDMRR